MIDSAVSGASSSGKVVGVIIPPPDIRLVVDKTALFVSRNGKSFEQRILASGEGKTAKFNFMKAYDPYHAYYEMKIREFEEKEAGGSTEEQKGQSTSEAPKESIQAPAPAAPVTAPLAVPGKSSFVKAKASIVNPLAVAVMQMGKGEAVNAPPPLEYSLGHPTGINPVDIDIIKLTAQYTAANGRDFLSGLAQREQKNPQFDFLKPTHVLFSYFTSLVDSYAKILQSPAEQIARIERNPKKVLEFALHRWHFTRVQEEKKRRETAQADEERLAFQSIDWQDFVVVETIDFPVDELFDVDVAPVPVVPPANQLSQLVESRKAELARPAPFLPPPPPAYKPPPTMAPPAMPIRPPSMPPPPPASTAFGSSQPPPPPPAAGQAAEAEMEVDEPFDQDIKVVANYQPRIASASSSAAGGAGKPLVMVDPISGKAIPVHQMEEHMRVQLLDPKWREEQKRFVEKQKESGFAEGDSIADSLRLFAKKRGDIFGQAAHGSAPNSAAAIAEEAALEKRRQEEASAVQWDGHQSSIPLVVKMKTETGAVSSVPSVPTPAVPVAGPVFPPLPAAPPLSSLSALQSPTLGGLAPSHSQVPAMVAAAAISAGAAAAAVAGSGPSLGMSSIPPVLPAHVPLAMGLPLMPIVPVPLPVSNPIVPYLAVAGTGVPPPATAEAPVDKKPQRELIPAEEFAAKYPEGVELVVVVPGGGVAADLQAWQLQTGQIFRIKVNANATVKEVKEMLSASHLNGMPAGKQQLKVQEVGFLKDASTLAALNIGDGTSVELSAKSRGGKK